MDTKQTTTKKVRRQHTVRLFLYVCAGFIAGILFSHTAEYAINAEQAERPVRPVATAIFSPVPQRFSVQEKLNLNTATYEELLRLPGIGPHYARTLIQYREEKGGFHFIEEIMDVPGIGEKRFAALQNLITCEP